MRAVASFAIELSAKFHNRLCLATAKMPQMVEQVFRLEVVDKHLGILGYIHQIEWVQTVLAVDVHTIVAVFQYIDNALWVIVRSRNNSVKPHWGMLDVVVFLHILEQVEAELIQAQIHNRNAGVHLLDVNDFFLQTKKLVATIFQVALFFG